jgi:hypothetical protein
VSEYRSDLELSDVPAAAEPPTCSAGFFIKPATGVEVRTLEYGVELHPVLRFTGLGHGSLSLHFEGGSRAVERLRDLLTDYLELVESAEAAEAVASEERRREADASEEGL